MALRTLSGAPSKRSDRCTCTRPSRKRMVVFRLVKRRKRTSSEGMGARGLRARYSSTNKVCNSGFTAFQPSRTWRGKPSPFLFLFFLFLFFLLLFDEILRLVCQHLHGCLVRALIGVYGRLARKVVLGTGFRLVEDGAPFSRLIDNLLQFLAQICMLLIEVVHVVLQFVGKLGELFHQVVKAHAFVLGDGVGVESMDPFGPVVDVSDEQLDPLQGLVSGLADVFDLLIG